MEEQEEVKAPDALTESAARPSTDSRVFIEIVSWRKRKRKRVMRVSGAPPTKPLPDSAGTCPCPDRGSSGEASSDDGESAEDKSAPDCSFVLAGRSSFSYGESDAFVTVVEN